MADGIIIIDKPAGWTSMDVCGKLRGILKTKKVGHAGTLDPMATGVLPVFVGQATRAVSFAESGSKEYVAGLHLGCVTNTQDTSGEVLAQYPVSVTRQELEALLPRFTGELMQVPPMYSAIKINGQKLYELARQGKEVARPPRPVTIYELEVLGQDESGDWLLRVLCSKGTYVRTLCHDIGQALGCGGCMSALRRTMAAGFTLAESRSIEDVQAQGEALLSPTDSLFRQYPAYHIAGERDHRRCLCGNPLAAEGRVGRLGRTAAEQRLPDAGAKLGGGGIGKGDDEEPVGIHGVLRVGDEPDSPLRQNSRFAAARRRAHQQRAAPVLDGGPLGGGPLGFTHACSSSPSSGCPGASKGFAGASSARSPMPVSWQQTNP